MKALPPTFGLPTDVDSLVESIDSPQGERVVGSAVRSVTALRQYLGWLRTAPMPQDESVVANCLADACTAALSVLASAGERISSRAESLE